MDNGAITCLFGGFHGSNAAPEMVGEETEARVGILNIAEDTKVRRILAIILHNHDKVFSYERAFIDRMTTLYLRNFTVAEADRIHLIRGRM